MNQERLIQMVEENLLDPAKDLDVGHKHGLVRLSLARVGAIAEEEPYRIWMSPGQAMKIIEALSWAVRSALKEQL